MIQNLDFCPGKFKKFLIPHPAQFAGKRAAVYTEEVGKFGAAVQQMITPFAVRCQRLQINFQPIPQTLLGKNTHLCIEEQKLLRHVLHQISGHLHPAGTAHGLLGHERTEIQPEHRTVRVGPQADRTGPPAGTGQFGPENLPTCQPADADLIAIFIIQKLFHCAIQQDACIMALFAQFHKMRIAGILMHACVQAVQNIPVAARLDAVEHSALL